MSEKGAKKFGDNVDALVRAKATGTDPREDVLVWARDLEDALLDKLADFGVIAHRQRLAGDKLGAFLDSYITTRAKKASTATAWGHTRRCLVDYFGADKPLAEITEGDADEWRLWLADHEKLADNTVRRRCGIAKQFFRAATKKELIRKNPFGEMRGCLVRENRAGTTSSRGRRRPRSLMPAPMPSGGCCSP